MGGGGGGGGRTSPDTGERPELVSCPPPRGTEGVVHIISEFLVVLSQHVRKWVANPITLLDLLQSYD